MQQQASAVNVRDAHSDMATGSTREFESIWDLWARQVQPLAAYTPYMTAVGNHEHYFNWTSYSNRYVSITEREYQPRE
jgi:hypothetical protein